MKNSIIIPTAFAKCDELLRPCLESIVAYTDLSETEVIVVSNGCTDGTDDYVLSLGHGFRLQSWPEPLGYPQAVNLGIEWAEGEFVIPFNNDNVLLSQTKNAWIDILAAPFADPDVAISGPWKNWCPFAERDFLIFFCVMIRKSVLADIGYLDLSFREGYGEDCDLCCKAVDKGYKVVQVPTPSKVAYDGMQASGQFPIYHRGNATFKNWPGGEELLRKNRQILKDRYATDIARARALDGFLSEEEMVWLARMASVSQCVIECGSWHGKSTRALADNLPPDGKLYAIDTWAGTVAEQDTNHASAKLLDGDHSFDEFCRGLWDHIAAGRVIPLRMHGHNAAALLQAQGVQADLIFIDADHSYDAVKADITAFLPLRKPGGIISGHDYGHPDGAWPGVRQAVNEIFWQNVGHDPRGTSIWYTDSQPVPKRPPAIFDCFPFNNELDILQLRFETLYDVVDRFVIVEGKTTHSGKPKELVFQANLQRFHPWLNKVTYIVVEDFPVLTEWATITDRSWARERHQRDCIMRGLKDCQDNDIVIISDCDEIPSAGAVAAVAKYQPGYSIRSLEMDLFYYDLNTKAKDKWTEAKILTYEELKRLSPCGARYTKCDVIPNAGRHLSYFGGVEAVISKIENTAHQEYNTPEFKDPERIAAAIARGEDVFGRPNVEFTCV